MHCFEVPTILRIAQTGCDTKSDNRGHCSLWMRTVTIPLQYSLVAAVVGRELAGFLVIDSVLYTSSAPQWIYMGFVLELRLP